MKQRTLILRVWRDAADALHVQLNDPLRQAQARFAASQDLWLALEQWMNSNLKPIADQAAPQNSQPDSSALATPALLHDSAASISAPEVSD